MRWTTRSRCACTQPAAQGVDRAGGSAGRGVARGRVGARRRCLTRPSVAAGPFEQETVVVTPEAQIQLTEKEQEEEVNR